MVLNGTQASESNPWLDRYLDEAVSKNLCVKVGCSTCGASEFRNGLKARAAEVAELPFTGEKLGRYYYREFVRQLSLLKPNERQKTLWFDAVRLIFCEIWPGVGAATGERLYQTMLEGTWAGTVLRSMQEHYRWRKAAQRKHEIECSPEGARIRREESEEKRED